MADITWTNVTDHASELSTVGAAAQTDILGFVNQSLDPALFDGETGYKTKLARVYLAAHFGKATLAGSGGAAGAVQSMSADGLSVSFATMAATLDDPTLMGTTVYGIRYLSILNASAARGPWVAC